MYSDDYNYLYDLSVDDVLNPLPKQFETQEPPQPTMRELMAQLIKTQLQNSTQLAYLGNLVTEQAKINEGFSNDIKEIKSILERVCEALNEEVDGEVIGIEDDVEEEVMEEVEQATMASTITEPFEVDVVIEEEVQLEIVVQEEGHLVEPEHIDFIFAPDDFQFYERARLLEFLPKIFSFGN